MSALIIFAVIAATACFLLYGMGALLSQVYRMFSWDGSKDEPGAGQFMKEATYLRAFTVACVGGLGGVYILIMFFGLMVGGPLEPPGGISLTEHIQRSKNGYYSRQSLYAIGWMAAYLTVVFLSHPWITESKTRCRFVAGLLLLPIIIKIPIVLQTIAGLSRQGMSGGDFILLLIVAGLEFSFFGLPLLSLYYSWKTREIPGVQAPDSLAIGGER